jgi:subtilisin family serine protease
MKKIAFTLTLAALSFAAFAQDPEVKNPEAVAAEVQAVNTDVQAVAAEAAAAAEAAPEEVKPEPKPKYWTFTLLNNINFGQTFLYHWAAGGYNTYSLAAGIDYSANYAKDKMIWNNRLQLDYGFLYSADKPILQTNKDRIYLESKWGLETPAPHLSWSAFLDFRTQFYRNYKYNTPTDQMFADHEKKTDAWKAARQLTSSFFSPAYINIGVGLLWTPKPWFSLNFAPITGGFVIVANNEKVGNADQFLRATYGMPTKTKKVEDLENPGQMIDVDYYKAVRYEFGAQLKMDAKWEINDNFSYSTQLAFFYNYLTPKVEPRINWDQKLFWKMAKYFALTLSTNLIYDPLVKVRGFDEATGLYTKKGVQFREGLELGFTYTFASKK